jgi:hypothetical protein
MQAARVVPTDSGEVTVCERNIKRNCRHSSCEKEADFLCDWPTRDGKKCEQPRCAVHMHPICPGTDYCDTHFLLWKRGCK